jgi:rhodanese-related sulfurtransferase
MAFAPLPRAAREADNGATFNRYRRIQMPSIVTEVAAAPSADALAHFEDSLRFETDCWDVHSVMGTPQQDFVLLDVRGTEKYAAGHVPGAVDLAHRKIIGSKLAEYPMETVFVTYCAGPHCNGAARAAIRLAKLGRPVKIMTGGITGWLDEGFALATSPAAAAA